METTIEIKNRIERLNGELSRCNNKNRKQNLRNLIKLAKAELKGNFITKSDLVEYKGLIIFIAKKSLYYNTNENLKAVMTELLKRVESKQLTFVNRKSIKSTICNSVKSIALELCDTDTEDFKVFRLNTLM